MYYFYAFVDPNNNITKIQTNVDPDVATKPGWRWLPIVEDPPPAHDPAIHKLERFQTIEQDRVYCYYIVSDKTPQEIDQEKTQAVDSINSLVLNVLLSQENRIRALEQQSTVTLEEYKQLLKTLV